MLDITNGSSLTYEERNIVQGRDERTSPAERASILRRGGAPARLCCCGGGTERDAGRRLASGPSARGAARCAHLRSPLGWRVASRGGPVEPTAPACGSRRSDGNSAALGRLAERRRARFAQLPLAIEAAIAGSGIALASHALVGDDLAAGRLVRPLDATDLDGRSLRYWIVDPLANATNPRPCAFRDRVQEEARRTGESAR